MCILKESVDETGLIGSLPKPRKRGWGYSELATKTKLKLVGLAGFMTFSFDFSNKTVTFVELTFISPVLFRYFLKNEDIRYFVKMHVFHGNPRNSMCP